MRKKPEKSIIAPVIVVVVTIAFAVFYGVGFLFVTAPLSFGRVLAVGVPAAIAVAAIWVLRQRISEIKSGEEDDLDRY